MYSFHFQIPASAWICFGIALGLLLPILWLYLRPLIRINNIIKSESRKPNPVRTNQPVSVIVFASDDAESLRHLLPSILGQKYNAPFEVIVVNEGESDATAEVVERLRQIHDNLYLTYTPDGARQLSRKKLALMIGIKAARFPIVVQTTAAADIPSEDWLSRLIEPFSTPGIEVVLGASSPDTTADTGFGRRYRAFNSVADQVVWLDSALGRHPYRGTELNLAYTRDVFFRNRGFSRSLNLKYGDDDIFISEIANARNTATVLHPDAMVRRRVMNAPRLYRELRSRYKFTGEHITRIPRLLGTLGNILLWAVLGFCVAGAWIMWPNLLGVALGFVIFTSLLLVATLLWRKTVRLLSGKSLMFSIPYLVMTRPVANMVANIKAQRSRKYNYTWN